MTIDYNIKIISIPSLNKPVPFKLIIDHDPSSLVNSLKNINITEDHLTMYERPSYPIPQIYPFETEKNIALNEIPLNYSQQNLVTSLLQKYQL